MEQVQTLQEEISLPKENFDSNQKSTKERVDERLAQIQNAMENISSSEEFKKYLETMGKFHNYSLNNIILITLQKPESTFVAGYNKWGKEFGRHVKQGEKGIEILAPAEKSVTHFLSKSVLTESQIEDFLNGENIIVSYEDKKNPNKNITFATNLTRFDTNDIEKFKYGKTIKEIKPHKSIHFRPVKVFDISQTEGKELPANPIKVDELKGEIDNFDKIMDAIKGISPCPIEFATPSNDDVLAGGAKGYYSPRESKIVIKDGMSQLQTVKTAVHEVAHSILHNPEKLKNIPDELYPTKQDREIQAESVACSFCYYFGLDTSEYSFGYIATWANANVDKFKQSMQLIRDTSSEIINSIDNVLNPEKYNKKEQEKTQEGRQERNKPIKSWKPKSKEQDKNKKRKTKEVDTIAI